MEPAKKEYIYVLGDADKVRERIEYLLFKNDWKQLTELSQNISSAIDKIKGLAIATMDAEIIMAGGDDILLMIPENKYKKSHLQVMGETFYNIAGGNISFGVSKSAEIAYINLRRAKTSKDDKIIEENTPNE